MSIAKRTPFALAVGIALALSLWFLLFRATCPACGGRVVKVGTVRDDTNAPSKNLCVWNRSICVNMHYGSDALICTRCWLAHADAVGRWERAAESPASFRRPVSSGLQGVPVAAAAGPRSRVVFKQTYADKAFAESVAFWCVDSHSLLAGLRAYCDTNNLTFKAENPGKAGLTYVTIE